MNRITGSQGKAKGGIKLRKEIAKKLTQKGENKLSKSSDHSESSLQSFKHQRNTPLQGKVKDFGAPVHLQ